MNGVSRRRKLLGGGGWRAGKGLVGGLGLGWVMIGRGWCGWLSLEGVEKDRHFISLLLHSDSKKQQSHFSSDLLSTPSLHYFKRPTSISSYTCPLHSNNKVKENSQKTKL
jgi:hypothetical protein